jgi:nucleoside-specific outer membrane channel protein Tsx
MKKALLAATVCAVMTGSAMAADLASIKAPPPPPPGPFGFLFEDTQIYFDLKPYGREPGIGEGFQNFNAGQNIKKYIFGLSHFDVWQYGTNFFNVEYLQSDSKDPPAGAQAQAHTGAVEVYGLYRGTLSFNSLSHSKSFSWGPVKDISFGFGVDANTKNTAFAPDKKLVVAGLRVDFAVPGVLAVQFNAAHEWNYNAFAINPGGAAGGKAVSFRTAPEIEIIYAQPLTFTGLPLSLAGFTNFVLPKGKDGFQNWTKTEINSETKLVLDIGKVVGYKPGVFDLFVGYKYWLNKFGNDHALYVANVFPPTLANVGSVEQSVFGGVAWHIF